MAQNQIRELATLPDGKQLRGFEVDFEILREEWSVYKTSDKNTVRVKNILVKVFRLVDEQNNPSFSKDGDPEYFVNTAMTVVARAGLPSKDNENESE